MQCEDGMRTMTGFNSPVLSHCGQPWRRHGFLFCTYKN